MDAILKALPYIVAVIGTIGGGMKWLYGAVTKERDEAQEERDKYKEDWLKATKKIEDLKGKLNKKEIEIVKLKLKVKEAKKDASFFDSKEKEK